MFVGLTLAGAGAAAAIIISSNSEKGISYQKDPDLDSRTDEQKLIKTTGFLKQLDAKQYIKCSYSYKDKVIINTDNDDHVDDVFVCLINEKVINSEDGEISYKINNRFPIFEFNHLNNRLSPLTATDYIVNENKENELDEGDITKNLIQGTGVKEYSDLPIVAVIKKKSLLLQEQKAREKALQIIKDSFFSIPHSVEYSMLDLVQFTEKGSMKFKGAYTRPETTSTNTQKIREDIVSHENVLSNNLRKIQIVIPPLFSIINDKIRGWLRIGYPDYIYNPINKKVEAHIDYNIFHENDPNYDGVTFDVYDILHTLAHEYGHHMTLYNAKITGQSFLDKLTELYSNQGQNEKFQDFVKLYKYFNSMNENEDQNFPSWQNAEIKFETIRDYDKEMIKLYRKYYSANVVKLRSQFTNYNPQEEWQTRTYNDIKHGLLKGQEKTPYYILPALFEAAKAALGDSTQTIKINEKEYQDFLNHIETEGYNVYKWDKDDFFDFTDGDNPLRVSNFSLVSKNFDLDNSTPAYIPDVFKYQEYLLNDKTKGDPFSKRIVVKENAIQNQGINFATLGGTNYEAERYRYLKYWQSSVENPVGFACEYKYECISLKIDIDMLNHLRYYYSWRELTARLFAILGYQYLDKRTQIPGLTRTYERLAASENQPLIYSFRPGKTKSIEQFSDYAMFKVLGIDPLINGKNRGLMAFLSGNNPELANQKNKKTEIIKNFGSMEGYKLGPQNFFLSQNYLTSSTLIRKNEYSIYALLKTNVNLRSKKLKIRYQNGWVREFGNYNYDHIGYFQTNDSEPSIDSPSLRKVSFFQNDVNSLIVHLGQHDSQDSASPYNSISSIRKNFGNIEKIWIDTDDDGVYDPGETVLPLS